MEPEPEYLRSIILSFPTEMASTIRKLCAQTGNEALLENLVRFLCGATHARDTSTGVREQWWEKQAEAQTILVSMNSSRKRTREEDGEDSEQQQQAFKRTRLATTTTQNHGAPLFALHSISTTSPIRKKVNITVHQNAVVFSNPLTNAIEGAVKLSILKRAFIVPTRGKSKPHWTVVLLSSDIPDNPKIKLPSASENQQVIFGVDAFSGTGAASFATTESYSPSGEPNTQKHLKRAATLPYIKGFLTHLGIPIILPSASTFKSSCGGALAGSSASADGIPGVEAYRAAKPGNLWFSEEGILWGESKPCEFWSVKDLVGRDDGVKIVGAGKTCTVVLTRRGAADDEGNQEDLGEETEFGMVDGRERDPIITWVRNRQHLFGVHDGASASSSSSDQKGKGKEKEVVKSKPIFAGPMTIQTIPDESDDDDEEFMDDSSNLDGSEGSRDGSSSDDSGPGSHKDNSEEDEEHQMDALESDDERDEEVEEPLDPARHPLLRPGAVPRMSKSTLDMVVGMVEEEFMSGSEQDNDELEEDELDD